MTKEEYAQLNYLLAKMEFEYLQEAIDASTEQAKYYIEILDKIKSVKTIVPSKMWEK